MTCHVLIYIAIYLVNRDGDGYNARDEHEE